MKRALLKRKTKLKAKRQINPVSKKAASNRAWLKTVANAVYNRAGGICEICHQAPDFRGLSIHHKVFRSHGGEDTLKNLVAVCGKCHSAAHGIREV